jgi:uncharacterized sulfatase
MGQPNFSGDEDAPPVEDIETNTRSAYADMDASPTKAWLFGQRNQPRWKWHYDYAFGKRPAEELYDLRQDPEQTRNRAADPAYAETRRQMSERLLKILRETADPRVTGDGKTFDRPPFTDPTPEPPRKTPPRKKVLAAGSDRRLGQQLPEN